MPLSGTQKLAVLAMPVAAIGLACFTSDPAWSPKRASYGSLRERKIALSAPDPVPAPAAIPAPAGTEAPAPAKPDPVAKKTPAPKAGPAPKGGGARGEVPAPTPPKKGDPGVPVPLPAKVEPEEPADKGIEFRASGLATVRFAESLRAVAADRLDVYVLQDGALRVGADFTDPDSAKESVRAAEESKKGSGLLYLVPNARAPWDTVRDLAAAGLESGWRRVGLCVAFPDDAGQGRVLVLKAPANEVGEAAKSLGPLVVKVTGAGLAPTYAMNGETCKDAAELAVKAKALHDEYEAMEAGYSADADKTAWTVDGTGASTGGVIAALDALTTAGVKAVRIEGIRKPAK